MPLTLEVNSIPYVGFTSASVTLSLDSLAHEFQFTATTTGATFLPFKGGEECRVLADDEVITTGFLEIIDVDYTSDSHTINIQGRSKTGDLVDSTLDSFELSGSSNIATCIKAVIEQLGLDITVTDSSGSDPFSESEDKIGPSIGQNAFDFISTLAKKRQVLLITDKNGNVLITRSESDSSNSNLVNQINGVDNNILSAGVSYDHTNRFNKYVVKSQLNPTPLIFGNGVTDLNSIVNQGGNPTADFVEDINARKGRQLVLQAEKASSTEQCKLRATWEANIRRARSSSYHVSLNSFVNSGGDRWSLNTVVNVVDQFTDINANKLINSITFTTSLSGDITQLGMVETEAYQVSLEEPDKLEEAGENLFAVNV